jgi:DNA polymerase-1
VSETATAVVEAPVESITVEEIALVDLSSIAYPIFHMSGAEPDPDHTSQKIVERVRALTANHPKAAICCDKGKSFRHDLNPQYKAQREAAPASLHHQIALAKERLAADGYPVWAVAGFEADDLIATATRLALGLPDVNVLIVSADKDLLQLVGPRVRVLSPASGTVYDAEAVRAKFGVGSEQIRDYLALVGDASDNVKGAKGIGKVKAVELLSAYGFLDEVYRALDAHPTAFKPAMATALREFQPRRADTVALITLRDDAEIPFSELDNDRAPKDAPVEVYDMAEAVEMTASTPADAVVTSAPIEARHVGGAVVGDAVPVSSSAPAASAPVPETKPERGNGNGLDVKPEAGGLAPAPVEFERQLEPRSIGQAFQLAQAMFRARMFNGYGTPEAVLSTVLMGRELGLQATASLRAFHLIEGKHALAADAQRGLVLRSGAAQYFRCSERTPERCTFSTHRKGDPAPIALSYTIAEARAAYGFHPGLNDKAQAELEAKWARSSWGKHPADMLAARASSKLARLVYSDILFGLYAPEELTD